MPDAGKLTPQEVAHAQSIGDSTVVLAPVPGQHTPKLLVASVIRKPPVVIEAWLKTLAWQQLRKPATLHYLFITDFPAGDPNAAPVNALLTDFVKKHKYVTIRHNVPPAGDFAETPQGHSWTAPAWQRVGAIKNTLLQACIDGHYDAVWLVDADVLCDPYTLQSLCDAECPIVAGVYWTHWQRAPQGSTAIVHAGPQVWLRHPYQLSGHGYSEADFRQALVDRQLLRVWGLGACTLLYRSALEKGVSFTPVPEGLPPGPMSDGEDRHLCERARRLHLPLYADAWPDIWHAFHAADYADIPRWLGRLASPRPVTPTPESLVSFKLELLEPIPHPQNPQQLQFIGPQFVRGRLGALAVLPEIAEALSAMSPGDRTIVRLHFPGHYAYATLRNQIRLVAVTLLDVRTHTLAPTIDEELLVGNLSKRALDSTTLSTAQLDSVLESAEAR